MIFAELQYTEHYSDLHDELQAFVYTAGEFYSRKDLAAWMKRTFAKEIDEFAFTDTPVNETMVRDLAGSGGSGTSSSASPRMGSCWRTCAALGCASPAGATASRWIGGALCSAPPLTLAPRSVSSSAIVARCPDWPAIWLAT